MTKREPIQHIAKDGLEWFKCKCGRKEFTFTKSIGEHGEPQLCPIERHFYCDCKKKYIWEYGNIRKG